MVFPQSRLELNKFNIEMIQDNSIVVILGRKGTGKSVLVKDILQHNRHKSIGTIISGDSNTEYSNQFYKDIAPSTHIYHGYNPSIIINKHPNSFLVMDDCLFDNSWNKNSDLVDICNNKELNTLVIITMQCSISNLLNIDYLILFHEPHEIYRRRLYQQYADFLHIFDSFDNFDQIITSLNRSHECLVIRKSTNAPGDLIYIYKASPNLE